MGINAVYNIINKILDPNINILYEPSYSLFDWDIRSMSYNFYSNYDRYYANYDLAILNDWQIHAVNRLKFLSQHQVSDLLFIHHSCPHNFKKEDKAIFENTTKNTYKIFLSRHIYDSWKPKDQKRFWINYGLDYEAIKQKISLSHKDNSILLLNTNNKPEINSLFKRLKNYYPDLEVLNTIKNYDETLNKISQYPIIIDLQNGLHTLYGIMCGARVITNQMLDTKLTSPIIISGADQIPAAINNSKANNDIDALINQDQRHIISSYNIYNFTSKLDSIIQTMKTGPFVL